jgi:hypothetical protein
MNKLDSFDNNKVKCRDCDGYFEKNRGGTYVDIDKDFNPTKDYYLCSTCIDKRMNFGMPSGGHAMLESLEWQ